MLDQLFVSIEKDPKRRKRKGLKKMHEKRKTNKKLEAYLSHIHTRHIKKRDFSKSHIKIIIIIIIIIPNKSAKRLC